MKKAFWILLLLLAVSVAVNVWLATRETAETTIERDTMWRDSIIREPLPAETINTGRVVYIKIPVAVPQPQTQRDTIRDSIEVPVPIVQKRYDDSLYTAWVSGYEPALDSIRLYLPEVTTTITETVVKSAHRLSIGIQGGAGVGVFSRQPDVYVGVGVQWRLWPK